MSNKQRQKWLTESVRVALITASASVITAIITASITIWVTALNNTEEIRILESELNVHKTQIQELQSELDIKESEINDLKKQLSIAPPTNTLLERLSQESEIQFEWQWTGENWYGRFILQKQGENYIITQAKVGLMEKNIEDRFLMNGQVLNLANTQGTFDITDDGLRIEIPVLKKDRRTGEVQLTTIKGILQQTLCYAGELLYSDKDGLYKGDIVLVDLEYAPSYASQLDDWFSNEQEWFDKYYIDRDK